MKSAILTGATGFIGSWLVEELLRHDVEVTVLVRNKKNILKKFINDVVVVEYQTIDVSNIELLREQYDIFYHLAWSGVSTEYKNNLELQFKNILYSIEMLKVAKKNNCKKFIGAGTVAEYVFCKDILDVNAKQTPNDIYGAAKVSTHYILDVLARQIGLPFIWTVLPSTYGERRQDSNIITYTIKTLLKGEKPIYGNLEQMWDFLYVSEVAKALYLIGEKGILGKTYGIGSGVYKPLKNYITIIRDFINPFLPLGIGECMAYSNQTYSSCVNIYELVKDTGFSVEVDFEAGIKKTIQYLKNDIQT